MWPKLGHGIGLRRQHYGHLLDNGVHGVSMALGNSAGVLLSAVVERADRGILLDINNIYVSSQNHGFDPHVYIDSIDPECVGQFHLAGHTQLGEGDSCFLADTHVGPTPDPVWALYRYALGRLGSVNTLIEWDDGVPAYEVVVAESTRAREIEAEVMDAAA